jgi:hypothetical protein
MILGLATDTMVVSIRIMKKPMTIDQRAGHGLLTFSKKNSLQCRRLVRAGGC